MRPLPPAPAPPRAPAAASSPSPRPSAPRAAPPPWQMAGPREAEALITAQQHSSTHRPGRSAISERQGSTTTPEGSRYRRRRPSPHLGLRVRSNGFASGSACNARYPSLLRCERARVRDSLRARGFSALFIGEPLRVQYRKLPRKALCGALTVILTCGAEQDGPRLSLGKESQRFVLEV